MCFATLQAKWEHDDLMLEASADLTELSPADLEAFEKDMASAFTLYQKASGFFFKVFPPPRSITFWPVSHSSPPPGLSKREQGCRALYRRRAAACDHLHHQV